MTMYTRDELRTEHTTRIWDERDFGDVTPNLRHYHAPSEPFACGDTLQTFLYRGWVAHQEVQRHVYWLSAMRSVSIYVFLMQRGDEEIHLPVQVNPFVVRFIHDQGLILVAHEDHDEWPSKSS